MNSIAISVFGHENKEKYSIYVSKNALKKDMLVYYLIGEQGQRHYDLIKDSDTFMCHYTLRRGYKHVCRYCLQAFSTEEVLKCRVKDCFKINGKQKFKMPKKGEYVRFKNYERKIKLPSMNYTDFGIILVLEDNGNQNPDEPYTKKSDKKTF